jgi:O-antigen ligase
LIALLTGTALISIIASSSRGGQIAVAIELTLLYVLTARVRLRSVVIGVATAAIGWSLVPAEQKARFQTMGDDNTSQLRLIAWEGARQATREHPVTGVGFENWSDYYSSAGGDGREIHNTVLEATAELGFPGLFFFLGAIGASFVMNGRTRRRARSHGEWAAVYRGMAIGLDVAMVGLFIAAQFMSVLFYPTFWMAFALTIALAETVRRAEAVGAPARLATRLPASHTPFPARQPAVVVRPLGASSSTVPRQLR